MISVTTLCSSLVLPVNPLFRDLVVCLVREVVLALLAPLVLVVLMAMLAPPALL